MRVRRHTRSDTRKVVLRVSRQGPKNSAINSRRSPRDPPSRRKSQARAVSLPIESWVPEPCDRPVSAKPVFRPECENEPGDTLAADTLNEVQMPNAFLYFWLWRRLILFGPRGLLPKRYRSLRWS